MNGRSVINGIVNVVKAGGALLTISGAIAIDHRATKDARESQAFDGEKQVIKAIEGYFKKESGLTIGSSILFN